MNPALKTPMHAYPGMQPFFNEQAHLMGLDAIPGGQPVAIARAARAVQGIENQISQAVRTVDITARPDILLHCEEHLATLELSLRAGILMTVAAYNLAGIKLPDWLNRYGPIFSQLEQSDPADEPPPDAEPGQAPAVTPPELAPVDVNSFAVALTADGGEPADVLESIMRIHHVNAMGYACETASDDNHYSSKWRHPTQDELIRYMLTQPPADNPPQAPPPRPAAAPKRVRKRT